MIFNKKDDLKIEKIMEEKNELVKIGNNIYKGPKNRMIKNSNPNRGQYMDGGMAKKKMMKGGRTMYSAGGNASVMPKATPN